jgi:hypothetical protein
VPESAENPAQKPVTGAPETDVFGDKAAFRKKQAVLLTFLGSLVKSSKNVTLYKDGHDMIGQIIERVMRMLEGAMGGEHQLTLEVKAKDVLFEGQEIENQPEVMGFAVQMHTLGVGQITFNNRLTPEGMLELMRIMTWKADDDHPLTELQKKIQELRIDGLSLNSIVSFITTEEESTEAPGALSEQQITAFCATKTLPDFVYLLFKQNEPLNSKAGHALGNLFEQFFLQEVTAEEFTKNFPWSDYDARIRSHWDIFQSDLAKGDHFTAQLLSTQMSAVTDADHAFSEEHKPHEAAPAFTYTLNHVHELLESPAGEKQPKYALEAYARLLEELGHDGSLDTLLGEYEIWRTSGANARWAGYLTELKGAVQERVPSAALSGALTRKILSFDAGKEERQQLADFYLTVGHGLTPHLLEDLRHLKDKQERQTLSTLIAQTSMRLGPEPIVEALKDDDYFFVVILVQIILEMNHPQTAHFLQPLLKYKHAKVRSAAVQGLRRFGGPVAVEGLAKFISSGLHAEEAPPAVTALSLIPEDTVGRRLVTIFSTVGDYNTRVALLTALGRFPSKAAEKLLTEEAKQTWHEWFSGVNKELRATAKESLAKVTAELTGGSDA